MMFSDFEWSDIFLGHYLLSVFVCLIAMIATYVISRTHTLSSLNPNKNDPNGNTNLLSTPTMKKSLAAEKVIKENMTKEQQLLEYEIRQKQLSQIHELMLKQSDKFGDISLADVEEQMKLYQ